LLLLMLRSRARRRWSRCRRRGDRMRLERAHRRRCLGERSVHGTRMAVLSERRRGLRINSRM
jgi:hypothetical protein